MKIAFTIATNNYLPSASAVGNSYLRHNPEDKFIIFLLDKLKPNFNLTSFSNCDIREVNTESIKEFSEMLKNYTLFEIITAIKPTLALNLLLESPSCEGFIFIDSDTLIYNSMEEIDRLFERGYEIILTTHFFTPLPQDGCYPDEKTYLNCGLHNAGFFAFKQGENTFKFLEWWEQRLKTECTLDFSKGLFYEQVWLNFVPQFFKNVKILEHPGYNVGYWNFHERAFFEDVNGVHKINENFPLVMFHFSGFDITTPDVISKYQNRYTFVEKPEFRPLFQDYINVLVANRFDEFANEKSYYLPLTKVLPKSSKVKRLILRVLTAFERNLSD